MHPGKWIHLDTYKWNSYSALRVSATLLELQSWVNSLRYPWVFTTSVSTHGCRKELTQLFRELTQLSFKIVHMMYLPKYSFATILWKVRVEMLYRSFSRPPPPLRRLAESSNSAHAHWVVGKCRPFRNDIALSPRIIEHALNLDITLTQKTWLFPRIIDHGE
jgi:hypothetical protein